MNRDAYPDDISDTEWQLIEPLILNKHTRYGRKPKYSKREMLNALFYLLRTGCSWHHLPHDFPPWKTVYTQFRTWKLNGFFKKVNERAKVSLRKLLKRDEEPSVGIVDSQSIKMTEKGGVKGYNLVKKINGRKRHILVDTQEFLITIKVTKLI